jgi:hypothetical protein
MWDRFRFFPERLCLAEMAERFHRLFLLLDNTDHGKPGKANVAGRLSLSPLDRRLLAFFTGMAALRMELAPFGQALHFPDSISTRS